MKKISVVILLCFTLGCTDKNITIDSTNVYLTNSATSDSIVSDGNSIKFVVGKETRKIALLEISSKAMTPNTLMMPFNTEGIAYLREILGNTTLEQGENVPLDIIKNNRNDYLACVLMRSAAAKEQYIMCELNGTAPKNTAQRRSIFFTIEFDLFYSLVDEAWYYMKMVYS